jgi:transcription antitermination factor NusG
MGMAGGTEAANDELRWFALRIIPQRELMAAKLLRHDGLVAEVKTEKRLRRRTKWDAERRYITYTAAPGYCFIAVPSAMDPRCYVRPFHIFRSFVGKDGIPAALDPKQMRAFLNLEDADLPGYYRHFKTGREFSIGDTVTIATGPFRDQQVRVEDVQDGEALFFMRLLGRDQEIRVSVNDVYKAEAA